MRLIDADELINIIIYVSEEYVNRPDVIEIKGLMIEMLNESPTVDAVPVVRCKDCIYFEAKNSLKTQGICMCGEKEMNYGGEFYPFADDFCSYGVKMDEGETQ